MNTVQANGYQFTYRPIGEGNPFNKGFWDIRSFTSTVVSSTTDKTIAESFNRLRGDDGRGFIGRAPANGKTATAHLQYEYNGDAPEGISFKAARMEEKWDIYIYGGRFYFARSWIGTLEFVAGFRVAEKALIVDSIDYADCDDFGECGADHRYRGLHHPVAHPEAANSEFRPRPAQGPAL